MAAVTTTDYEGLTLVARGKVRDIYATSVPTQLLFVATDRISAYDVILNNVRVGPMNATDLSHASKLLRCNREFQKRAAS